MSERKEQRDQRLLTEIPSSLKQLARLVVRGFYTIEDALIIDMLVRNPCKCRKERVANALRIHMNICHFPFTNRYERRRYLRATEIRTKTIEITHLHTSNRQISASPIENGNRTGRESSQSQLLLHQLQNVRQCCQIQIRFDAEAHGDGGT